MIYSAKTLPYSVHGNLFGFELTLTDFTEIIFDKH